MKNAEQYMSNKWYQEATIGGVEMPRRRNDDTSEKRWRVLLEPLIPKPKSGDAFIELGSNAGFYLRKAVDLGYKAIGVEISDEFVAQAKYWEDNEPKGTKTIQEDLNKYDIPAANVVLLANIIYWLTPEEVLALVERLKNRALNVVVIGRYKRLKPHKSPCTIDRIKKSFGEFETVDMRNDEKLFSILFKNPLLCEKKTDELSLTSHDFKHKLLIPAINELLDMIEQGENTNPANTLYYKYLITRDCNPRIRGYKTKQTIRLIKDIKNNGIRKPICIGRINDGKYNENCIYDGDHRFLIAKRLGINNIICQKRG